MESHQEVSEALASLIEGRRNFLTGVRSGMAQQKVKMKILEATEFSKCQSQGQF